MNLPTFAAALALGTIAWAGGSTTPSNRTPATTRKPMTASVKKPVTASLAIKKPVTAAVAIKKPLTATAAKRTVKAAPVAHTTWRNRQSSPTADRYREIQQALAERGYLSPEDANGAWSASSTDALKRFQAEQTLESTGRIDSLSLIALGLGPKHDSGTPRVVDGNLQLESGHN